MQTATGSIVEFPTTLLREGGFLEVVITVHGESAPDDGPDGLVQAWELRFIRAVDLQGRGVVLTSAEMNAIIDDRDGEASAALAEDYRREMGY